MFIYWSGGEWFFKNSRSRKILVEFHGSRSLVFWVVMCVSQSRFLYEGVSESQNTLNSQSCNLKSQNVSGSQRKTLVLPSRKVLHLPFVTPIIDQLIIVCCFQIWDFSFRVWFEKTYPYLCVPVCIILYILIIASDQSILKQQAISFSRQCILTTLHTNNKIKNG